MRWRAGRLVAVLAVTVLVVNVLAVNAPQGAHADASIDNWTADLCTGVADWFAAVNTTAPQDAGVADLLTIRRYVDNLVNDAHIWVLSRLRYAPPVDGGRKLRSRTERAFLAAVDELDRASSLLARPLTPQVGDAAERHLRAGYDKIVATMQHLRGHTGNATFDRAMVKNKYCDYIPRLSPSGQSVTS